jgi:hypothetical protein
MIVRLILAAVLAGVVQMAWGFAFWAISPIPKTMMGQVPDQAKLLAALKDNLPESGVYFMPCPDNAKATQAETAEEVFFRQHREGPLVQICYHREGKEPMGGTTLLAGQLHCIGSCLVMGLLMLFALPNLNTYIARVLFVSLAGVFVVFSLRFQDAIWFLHSWDFTLMQSGFDLASWLLAGVIMGAIIRPQS